MSRSNRRVRGNWLKIKRVYFGWDWGNWSVGFEIIKELRQTHIVFFPFHIGMDHERIVVDK